MTEYEIISLIIQSIYSIAMLCLAYSDSKSNKQK